MNIRYFILFISCLLLFSCSGGKVYGEEGPELEIIRFDTELYNYLTNNRPESSLSSYNDFLDLFGQDVIYIGKSDSSGFYNRLKEFFSEPTLMGLYSDEQKSFFDIQSVRTELSYGLDYFLKQFPSIAQPRIYMHVSGLNQNIVVTDSILSISADKYLGADYPLYQDFFYDYQRQLMTSDRIVPDYLLGFMMANFPFEGNDDILLDKILYEGKLRYILSRMLPERQVWEYVGYTKDEYLWCSNNQSRIWKTILENQHLFSPNYVTTSQYLKEAPYTALLPVESPGRVGIWLGYQIIISYMKHKPDTSLSDLMGMTDYNELLKQSKYKP